MATAVSKDDLLKAVRLKMDYYSGPAVLSDMLDAAGLGDAETYDYDALVQMVEDAKGGKERTHARAAAALEDVVLAPLANAADAEREKAERQAREAAEREAQAEAERKAREEAERKAKEEAERKAREEAERKAKEEAERKAKEEAERKAREEAERKAKEEAERKAKEEAERKAKEEAERKAKEEAERKAKEEAERKAREEAERKAKEEAERKAKEEAERKAKEEAKRVAPRVYEATPGPIAVEPQRPTVLLAPGPGHLHWSTNGWSQAPPDEFYPEGTVSAQDAEVRRTPLVQLPDHDDRWGVVIPPFDKAAGVTELNYTFQFQDGNWWSKGLITPTA